MTNIWASRDLQGILNSVNSPSSIYNISHATTSTDPTVYPEPSGQDELEKKKRKRLDTDGNDVEFTRPQSTQYARLPNLIHANKHIVEVHKSIKKECEDMVMLVVSLCRSVRIYHF